MRKMWNSGASALALITLLAVSGARAEDLPQTEPQDTYQLAAADPVFDRIVVVGSQLQARETAGAAQYISEVELEKFEYQDVNRILRAVPGVNLQEEDGFGLRPNIGLRGTGLDRSSKVAILEDGVLAAPAPYAAPSAYYFPVAGRMSAVEVVKGPSAIKYGPLTTGGAVNLFSTAIPDEPLAQLTARAGTDDYRMSHVMVGNTFAKKGPKFGALLESFHVESGGFKNLDGGGDTGFDIDDFVAKFSIASRDGADRPQRLQIKLQYSDELSSETYLGLTEEDYNKDAFRRYRGSQMDAMDAEHNTVQINHTIELTPAWDLTTVIYRNQFQRNWYKLDKVLDGGALRSISSVLSDPETFAQAYDTIVGSAGFVSADDALSGKNNNREYKSEGIQVVLGYSATFGATDHQFEFSVRHHEDEEDRYQWVDGFRMDNGVMVLTSEGVAGTDSNRISSAQAWSYFVRDEISVGNWTIVPGLRYEGIDLERKDYGKLDPDRTGASLTVKTHSVDVWIPGIGFTYSVNDNWMVLGGVYKGFTNPSPGSTSDAEESVNYEFGLRFGNDSLTGDMIAFFNDYENLVGTCTASTGGGCIIGDQFDGGKVDVFGLEATLGADLVAGQDLGFAMPLTLAYTLTRSEFQTSFVSGYGPWGSVNVGDEMPYIPEHQLNLGLGLEFDHWRTNVSANYVSKARATAGEGAIASGDSIEARVLVDWSVELDLSGRAQIFASAENLFDETYIASRSPAGLRPGKPQNFFVGLRLRY
ncbi:MAG: TonB-dependent receptor [Alphaproteobacteria bacterium]|nr:MAG: TonB-dependent receptor [Alphaproteobacteria bacterium]